MAYAEHSIYWPINKYKNTIFNVKFGSSEYTSSTPSIICYKELPDVE